MSIIINFNLELKRASEFCSSARKTGKTIGFACGVFDLFHYGHVLMLRECKEECDILIIGLNTAEQFSLTINPGKKKPIYTFQERKGIMENSRYVDAVIGYSSEEDLLAILQEIKPDVRFLGDDYKGKPITGGEFSKKIYYTDRTHGLSTTLYRDRIKSS